MRGVVTEFDDHKGWGTITADDGGEWFFHCTQIADGSRTIVVAVEVSFEALPRMGRYEATAVTPAP